MYFSVVSDVLLEYIVQLQDFFQNDPAMQSQWQRYKWNPDPNLSKVWISDEFPENDAVLPPYIVLNGGTGSSVEIDLGQFMAEVVDDSNNHFVRYGGIMNLSVDMYIAGLTAIERADIADLVLICLVHKKRELLINKGIVPRSTRVAGMSEEPYGNSSKMFLVQIAQSIDVHWFYDVPVTDTVGSVDIDIETI
jgi:hypothetical protein